MYLKVDIVRLLFSSISKEGGSKSGKALLARCGQAAFAPSKSFQLEVDLLPSRVSGSSPG